MQEYNVLVVDDDNDNEIKESIEIYLKNEEIRVIEACDSVYVCFINFYYV